MLWRDPGPIASRDLFWGSGSADRSPQPPFTFVKEDLSGTKPKVHVVDNRGVAWSVKFDRRRPQRGVEVPTEIAAARLTWALGYLVEESYLVTDGVVTNVGRLERARSAIGVDGAFRAARFELRPADVERLPTEWTVDNNPFVGSKELSGLVLLAAMLNNWDFRPGNFGVLRTSSNGTPEDWYLITDLGTAFGGMGGVSSHRSKWDLKDYQAEKAFIGRVDGDTIELHFKADGEKPARIPIEHARWFAGLARQLTEPQVRKAFHAAGASDEEARGFTARFLEKARELDTAVSSASR